MANDPYWNNNILLIHADDSIADNSISARPATTKTGSAVAPYTAEKKYGAGSLRLDGASYVEFPSSNDWVLGTGDFTVEAWVYPQASGVWQNIIGQWADTTDFGWSLHINNVNEPCFLTKGATDYYLTAGAALPLNTWAHVAVVHKNGVRRIFVNGYLKNIRSDMAGISTGTNTFIRVGRSVNSTPDWFTGLVDDIRITKGVARYDLPSAVAIPTAELPLDASDPYWGSVLLGAAMNSASLSDAKGHTVSNSGAAYNTTTKKFGSGSAYFNGSSYLVYIGLATLTLGANDFTIEMWVYPTVEGGYLIDWRPANTDGVYPALTYGGGGFIGYHASASQWLYSTVSAPLNQWSHIAVVRTGKVTCIYVNGIGSAHAQDTNTYLGSSDRPVLGAGGYNTAAARFTGYIDDVRVTLAARYYGNFTPPVSTHPEGLTTVSGTVLDHTGQPCARRVNVHSRASGRLLGTAVSDPLTGVYSIGAAEECYAVVLDSTGGYNAQVLDHLNPLA